MDTISENSSIANGCKNPIQEDQLGVGEVMVQIE
jgi:hypothetical protein